ncbi:Unknown protein, partial [Striga hermonthica]
VEGKWRMCIDFRDMNKACPQDLYPLPKIDQFVDSTAGCELLRLMDVLQGYHQIPLAREDRKRVSFVTSRETYCYVVMPFGLKNAGATYQRLVEKIFKKQLGRNMEVYVDDMLVKSKEAMDYVRDLRKILNAEEVWDENSRADLLSKIAQSLVNSKSRSVTLLHLEQSVVEAEIVEIEEVEDWRAPILRELKEKAMEVVRRFFEHEGILYKRSYAGPHLRCVTKEEGRY